LRTLRASTRPMRFQHCRPGWHDSCYEGRRGPLGRTMWQRSFGHAVLPRSCQRADIVLRQTQFRSSGEPTASLDAARPHVRLRWSQSLLRSAPTIFRSDRHAPPSWRSANDEDGARTRTKGGFSFTPHFSGVHERRRRVLTVFNGFRVCRRSRQHAVGGGNRSNGWRPPAAPYTSLKWGVNERPGPLSVFHACQSVAQSRFLVRAYATPRGATNDEDGARTSTKRENESHSLAGVQSCLRPWRRNCTVLLCFAPLATVQHDARPLS